MKQHTSFARFTGSGVVSTTFHRLKPVATDRRPLRGLALPCFMGHSFTDLLVHAVWSTKNREPLIEEEFRSRMHEYIGGVCRAERCSLVAVNSMSDHVHALVVLHASANVADLMRVVKSRTSGWIHETFASQSHFAWQAGYGAFSVSQSSREAVVRYIAQQQEHHKAWDFKTEFVELLRRHNIEFDERYVWG